MKKLFIIYVLALVTMAMAEEKNLENLLHEGNNKLTAKMFSEVANANKEKSFVLSAYSVMTPLAQLGLASLNETHDELLQAVGMPDDNTTKKVFSLANTRLRFLKGVTLKTASKIYVAKNYELNSNFTVVTRDAFGSEIQNINFGKSEAAAKEINAWVEQQTNNRIKELVDPSILSHETRALLVNAIYFKGLWKIPFDKTLTQDRKFFINKSSTINVPMMSRSGEYKYAVSSKLKSQIIEIPYEGDESSLIIVLPRDIEGIHEVKQMLKDPKVLEDAFNQLHELYVDLYLPKFKIETTTDLKEILKKMNIQRIFNQFEAKLEKLIQGATDLYVDTATQKAFIEVNEEGAEAAAANVFSVAFPDSVDLTPNFPEFLADHPFIFYLRGGNNILFSGIYNGSE